MSDKVRVAAVELNVTEHCNLACEHCDHSTGIVPQHEVDPAECATVMGTLAQALHATELRIIGGEPLLHPHLADVLLACRNSHVADYIVLWTNGLLLDHASEDVWRQIDGVVWSTYPGLRYKADRSDLQPLLDRHSVWLLKRYCPEFSLCNTTAELYDGRLIQFIYRTCSQPLANSCHTIRNGRYFKCVQSAFAESRLAAYGVVFNNQAVDGVQILGNPCLRHDLQVYLANDAPLMACSYCLGDIGRRYPYRQLQRPRVLRRHKAKVRELLSSDVMLPSSWLQDEPDPPSDSKKS